jgi:hypothetical protein
MTITLRREDWAKIQETLNTFACIHNTIRLDQIREQARQALTIQPLSVPGRCEHDTEFSWVLTKNGHQGSVLKKFYHDCPYCPSPSEGPQV